ncbi:MAG: ABC transporter ATP-binding protein [Proteobacteria bacterium]|nr:ABC transporter ATP-binding protein [Pseudomonadota bacterium]
MNFISVNQVSYAYSGTPVLSHVSLSVTKGDILSVLGPNGSGKTTLLKLILGFFQPDSGTVHVDGQDVGTFPTRMLARKIAYVPQVHRMAFSFRMMDVVMMGRIPHKPFIFRYSKKDKALAETAMERMGIAHLKDRSYTEVSGGERQLCLIARALAQGADTFVMDEPVSGLDYGNQVRLLTTIRSLASEGYTFIKTTHFPDHALWMSGQVLMLKKGRVVITGPSDDVITQASLSDLYHLDMDVAHTLCGTRVCVPDAMRTGRVPLQ